MSCFNLGFNAKHLMGKVEQQQTMKWKNKF